MDHFLGKPRGFGWEVKDPQIQPRSKRLGLRYPLGPLTWVIYISWLSCYLACSPAVIPWLELNQQREVECFYGAKRLKKKKKKKLSVSRELKDFFKKGLFSLLLCLIESSSILYLIITSGDLRLKKVECNSKETSGYWNLIRLSSCYLYLIFFLFKCCFHVFVFSIVSTSSLSLWIFVIRLHKQCKYQFLMLRTSSGLEALV